jgi:uncharacterized protein
MNDSQTSSARCFELLQSGDSDGLRRLLEQEPEAAEARDSKGVSLLMQCIYRGQREIAGLVADKKASLDIFEAASLGRLDRLQECVRQKDDKKDEKKNKNEINARSQDGFTALHFACYFGQPEAARLLIESGAAVDVVASNPTQVMPLHSAASARNVEAARLLLEHGAPVNARQQAGWVPIHAAALNGDRALVDLLLAHHADTRLANDDGKTPSMVAREKGHDAIAVLLEK